MTTKTTTRRPRTVWLMLLTRLEACDEAREWARSLPTDTTAEAAWTQCPRGDWMLWLLGRLHVRGALTRQRLVLASCAVARTALPHLAGRTAEAECVAALDVTERWCRGEATLDEVITARRAAWEARDRAWAEWRAKRADAAAAAYAAAAAAAAAYADAAAYAAAYAAADADAAYAAAAAYADAYARKKSLAATADVVRGVIPWSEVEASLAKLRSRTSRAEAAS